MAKCFKFKVFEVFEFCIFCYLMLYIFEGIKEVVQRCCFFQQMGMDFVVYFFMVGLVGFFEQRRSFLQGYLFVIYFYGYFGEDFNVFFGFQLDFSSQRDIFFLEQVYGIVDIMQVNEVLAFI